VYCIFFVNYFEQIINKENTVHTKSSSNYYFFKTLWIEFYNLTIDNIPYYKRDLLTKIKKHFFDCEWYEVYDFIEFIIQNPDPAYPELLIDSFNHSLKKELSGYRIISKNIVRITNENELTEINKIIESEKSELNTVKIHIQTAISKLSDKKEPDYRNSIKESISALEALCKIISGNKKDSLKTSLTKINEKISIHNGLMQGFLKIYGYTSDSDGIRHAMLEKDNLQQEDAILMLVMCSSFINYIVTKSEQNGLIE
ncbi:conserved hypothetical protein, partial [Formosa agariphila KMM 3901]